MEPFQAFGNFALASAKQAPTEQILEWPNKTKNCLVEVHIGGVDEREACRRSMEKNESEVC